MPHWQSIVAMSVVAITLLVFLLLLVRPKKSKSGGCGHDCGCGRPGQDKLGKH